MDWKSLFIPGKNMSAEEAKKYMTDHRAGEYQLLDVRQPKEYEDGHIGGATLIPIKELPDRVGELDPEKPVIAYCAVGGRSKAAAQFLAGKGFREVYNMSGGIKSWKGQAITGTEEAGLELLVGVGDFHDAALLAYAMEDGLQKFYKKLLDDATDPDQRKLLDQLVGFESKHKARLLIEYRIRTGQAGGAEELLDAEAPPKDVMEGGLDIEDFFAKVRGDLKSRADVLELAMMMESQAYDLYMRMAARSSDESARKLFHSLADEERVHLGYIARELDRIL